MGEDALGTTAMYVMGAAILLVLIISWLLHEDIPTGSLIALRSVATGKYLRVSLVDGLLYPNGSSSSDEGAVFVAMPLSPSTIKALRPVMVKRSASKSGCECSGQSDEFGFGRFCHGWESQWHRPWCYVKDTCVKAPRGRKLRRHQVCDEEVGYLGPDGYKSPPGCPCSGLESVHGFGAHCKGWEYAGQTPWCYTLDNCTNAVNSAGGSFGSKFVECVSNISSPPSPPPSPAPPPPPPSPPAPTPPPPDKWVESRKGWGTPSKCACTGYSNKHGYGAYCKAWEVPEQTPWCYIGEGCPLPASGLGTFKHRFLECSQKPSASWIGSLVGRRLEDLLSTAAAHPPPPPKPKSVGISHKAKRKSSASKKTAASSLLHKRLQDGLGFIFDVRQFALRKNAVGLPHLALRSLLTNGFVAAAPPPHPHELFLNAQAEALTSEAVFAVQQRGQGGPVLSHGLGAYLNLCQVEAPAADSSPRPTSGKGYEGFAVCAATPSVMQKRVAALPGKAHHRQLQLENKKTGWFIVERV